MKILEMGGPLDEPGVTGSKSVEKDGILSKPTSTPSETPSKGSEFSEEDVVPPIMRIMEIAVNYRSTNRYIWNRSS